MLQCTFSLWSVLSSAAVETWCHMSPWRDTTDPLILIVKHKDVAVVSLRIQHIKLFFCHIEDLDSWWTAGSISFLFPVLVPQLWPPAVRCHVHWCLLLSILSPCWDLEPPTLMIVHTAHISPVLTRLPLEGATGCSISRLCTQSNVA